MLQYRRSHFEQPISLSTSFLEQQTQRFDFALVGSAACVRSRAGGASEAEEPMCRGVSPLSSPCTVNPSFMPLILYPYRAASFLYGVFI